MSADNWTICPRCKDDDHTFREDYEIYGASQGTVVADYSGSCTSCGLSVSFEHSECFWPEPESVA